MNNAVEKKEQLTFEDLGLEVAQGEVSIGSTYPLFGVITKIQKNDDGEIIAEINNHIRAKINVSDDNSFNILQERAFETAIFVSTVTAIEPNLEVNCKAVIFGKKQGFNA